MIIVPNSYGVELQEFNQCHEPGGKPEGGQFCSGASSAAFQEWFKGSKVVDSKGRPLRVFHATNNPDIDEFRPFSHFGTSQAANDRASTLEDFSTRVVNRDPGRFNVIPVYLSISRPLRMPDLAGIDDKTGDPLPEDWDDAGPDDEIAYPRGWEGEEAIATTLLEMGIFDIDEFEEHRSNESALEYLRDEKGYDGIVYENVVEDPGHDSYIIFDPSQVKSALSSKGFNPKSRRITEFNHCHNPAGSPVGGEFCSKGSQWWQSSSKITAKRRATRGPMRPGTEAEKRKLRIPPAYTDVMVATDPKAELRATAKNAAGQTMPFYTKAYQARGQKAKWSRVAALQRIIGTVTERIDRITASPRRQGYSEAMALRLIASTGIRNGAENEAGAFGASSLLMEHVTLDGNTIRLQFAGKGGKAQDHTLTDAVLANYFRGRQAKGLRTAFDHDADDTLAMMKKLAGPHFVVHDLRTLYATTFADRLVQGIVASKAKPRTKKEWKAVRKQIATLVGEALVDTPGMALNKYIHPAVWRPIEVT